MSRALTPAEVAARWQCSERKVRYMVERGVLPGFNLDGKLLRLRLADVEEFECGGSPGLKANAASPGTDQTPTIPARVAAPFAKFPPGSENLSRRFWALVAMAGPDDCWPWTATKTGNGYGNFKAPWGPSPAHRIAYWLATCEYPEKLLVRHKCDNPICCNPAHLELGTKADNYRDWWERGRHREPTP